MGTITVDASGSTVSISGVLETSIQAAVIGGAKSKVLAALSNAVTSVKGTAGTFKGLFFDNTGAAAINFVQVFDAATPGAVTLGVTVPVFIAAASAGGFSNASLPPEGIALSNGLQIAATTTALGAGAPAVAPNVDAFYF
jgi:hypothetical protein